MLRVARLLLRAAVVACLLLAAILLAADAGEYPRPSAAGLRALGRGALPLLALGVLHLALLPTASDAPTSRRLPLVVLAVAGDLALLGAAGRALLRPGAPPAAWLAAGCASLLLIATVTVHRAQREAARGTAA